MSARRYDPLTPPTEDIEGLKPEPCRGFFMDRPWPCPNNAERVWAVLNNYPINLCPECEELLHRHAK